LYLNVNDDICHISNVRCNKIYNHQPKLDVKTFDDIRFNVDIC